MKMLVLNHHLKEFAGSELHTFDICVALKEMGHEIVVGTFLYGYPLQQLFEREGFVVINFLEETCQDKYFDVIIGHHFPILCDALIKQQLECNKLIFHSMSTFEPLEEFIIFDERYCLYTVNSEENRQKKIERSIQEAVVFPNPVPEYFFSHFSDTKPSLHSVAIVSNHLCAEINDAAKALEASGIQVDIYGQDYKFQHITPELLLQYNVVMSIGRTVQYGLALGIPVYCYDHFGGPGWLTSDNVETAAQFNFSGRCCHEKKSAEKIVEEVTCQYDFVIQNKLFLHNFSQKHYNLEKNLVCLLEKTQKKLNFCLDEALQNVHSIECFVHAYRNILSMFYKLCYKN